MVLRNRLRELRARDRLSQEELGRRTEVSRQTISLIERGDHAPSVALALKLARVFQVSVEEIFFLEDDEA